MKRIAKEAKSAVFNDATANALSNLQNFKAQSIFKQATFAFLAAQCLTPAEKAHIDKIFRALDINGDGCLDIEEFKQGFRDFYGDDYTDG